MYSTIRQKLLRLLGLSFCLLPLFLSSCATVGPDFTGLEGPKQEEWREDAKLRVVTDTEDDGRWWEKFNDPILTRLIEHAHQENLSLQVAGLRILEAHARLGVAMWNQFPQDMRVSGSYSNQNNFDVDAEGLPDSYSDQVKSLELGAFWELDFWGRFRRGVEAEQASLYASYANYDDVLVLLTAQVATTYINICAFEERLRIAKQNEALQQRSLDIAQVRYRNATVTELDVRRAESLLMQTKSLIPSLELGIRQSKDALAVLLGMSPLELYDLVNDVEFNLPTVPQDIVVGVPADLLRRRPDIRRAELMAASQSARIGVAKADLFPSFYLGGAIGTVDQNVLEEGGEANVSYAIIQPGFSWKILNFGRIKNSVRIRDARFQQAILKYENTVLNAYREVESAMAAYNQRTEQVLFLEKGVDSSRRSVKLALIQYRDGKVDYTPVVDTQTRLAFDEDSLIASRGRVLLSLVNTYKALGGGWESRLNSDLVSDEVKTTMTERTNWGDILNAPAPEPGVLPKSPRTIYTLGND